MNRVATSEPIEGDADRDKGAAIVAPVTPSGVWRCLCATEPRLTQLICFVGGLDPWEDFELS